MKRARLYQPFEIAFHTLDECPMLEHGHSFFELVYIRKGTGKQYINNNKFDYLPGHLFLLTPQDSHFFEVETTTSFFFLKFNNIYIKEGGFRTGKVEQLEYIIQNASHKPGCILRNPADKAFIEPMVEAIIRAHTDRDFYDAELTEHLVHTLIVIVARNIARYLPETIDVQTEDKAMQIVEYIQQNIYDPDKIRTKAISEKFGISESYLGRYFKKHIRESLREYIVKYRLRLVEHRLRYSDLRIGEIAHILGFSDESHLNKFFKKNRGMSPVAYRNEMREIRTSA